MLICINVCFQGELGKGAVVDQYDWNLGKRVYSHSYKFSIS